MADEHQPEATPQPKDQTSPRDKLALLLISGVSAATAIDTAVIKLGIDRDNATTLVNEAQAAIHGAAEINRRNELGTAVTRLRDLYTKSVSMRDLKTALAAQKELNRLCGLYTDDPDAEPIEGNAEAAAELEAIAAHLLPLQLAPADVPLDEHARIAAERIRSAGAPTFPR